MVITIELCKYCINEELHMADQLIIGRYVGGLNSELFLHTDKNHSFLLLETIMNAEKHLHFDFVSVHVCSRLIFS